MRFYYLHTRAAVGMGISTPSHLAPLIRIIHFEFMEMLYVS